MSTENGFDAIVIGAGHNGMVCAFYLARARRRVLVLDAADSVGGAARPVTFGDLTVPFAAHLDYGLSHRVIDDMDLKRHGLAYANRDVGATATGADGRRIHYTLGGDTVSNLQDAPMDAQRWPEFRQRMQRFAGIIDDIAGRIPPRLGGKSADARAWLSIGWRLRRLGKAEMREFLRIGAINIYDVLEEHFDDPLFKGALAAEALLGHGLAPRSPNSVLTFLMRLSASGGAAAMPRGGMCMVTTAIRAACESRRVSFRLNAPVRRIVVENDRAIGVELDSGEVIQAPSVISSSDARSTCLNLIGADHLDTGLVRRLRHVRGRGCTARIDFLLDDLSGLDHAALARRMIHAPDMDTLERAFNDSKYGAQSTEPMVELVVPTLIDPTQRRGRHHLATALVQYVPRDLGESETAVADTLLDNTRAVIERMVPGLAARIVDTRITTPATVERATGVDGGHWHHAEIALDQYFMLRPVPALARYQLPIPGAWLCGAATHPGGGITGLPGRNAALHLLATQVHP